MFICICFILQVRVKKKKKRLDCVVVVFLDNFERIHHLKLPEVSPIIFFFCVYLFLFYFASPCEKQQRLDCVVVVVVFLDNFASCSGGLLALRITVCKWRRWFKERHPLVYCKFDILINSYSRRRRRRSCCVISTNFRYI